MSFHLLEHKEFEFYLLLFGTERKVLDIENEDFVFYV